MDYPVENLGPEKFQEFCQALLVKEYPGIRCFPVAQPDGGRDALEYRSTSSSDTFNVYQVKFARKPLAEQDPHKWLLDVITKEVDKIKTLIPRGASQYILLTNVPGTAHLDTGSIDTLDRLLSERLGIPSMCWWRNDINRRLDSAWSIKWAYPEIMVGPDFLRAIIESGINEHQDRRNASIRAFLRHQYVMDEEVRFKQVELQNKLLDLFIDVPLTPRDLSVNRDHVAAYHKVATDLTESSSLDPTAGPRQTQLFNYEIHHWQGRGFQPFGAATLLLSPEAQVLIPNVVIEGAPGQGKSTIVQYVCQVHRMKLLRESGAIIQIPETHQKAPLRLPIKVDLRDFATWINQKNPFVAESSGPLVGWQKSLETFLAALISHQSGGTAFVVDDLIAVSKISSLLLVFDGLDEVADIATRTEVVDEILKGVQRLQENAASVQTVVTSRPAAFANSPGMPERKYLFLQLLSLSPELIIAYADRWMAARRLETKLGDEFRTILKTKLDQPHLRDLARNPMQLAILLSLILTRGASLPDKRTALYDQYMDLFFSREAGKSTIVRDHRDLLIELHRYLAWLLHCEAEKGEARASIAQDRLQSVVAEYLLGEGYEPHLASLLFSGVIERVVVLVSRIQGTFEFEVQPIREYFAACFLFYTAPNSSPGKERSGSRPDRFHAVSRNFYWLNVTRFYAGCYSKGELPSLVELLQELCAQEEYKRLSDPRVLAATLSADWVFTQNPRSVQQVVELIMEPVGLRSLLVSFTNRPVWQNSNLSFTLPSGCGREQVLTKGFELLASDLRPDFASQICALMCANGTPEELAVLWSDYFRRDPNKRRWLEHGFDMDVLASMPKDALHAILGESDWDSTVLDYLFRANRPDVFEDDPKAIDTTVAAILQNRSYCKTSAKTDSPISALYQALNPLRYHRTMGEKDPRPLSDIWPRTQQSGISGFPREAVIEHESISKCLHVVQVADEQSKRTMLEWATEIGPWERLVEAAREFWGPAPLLIGLAVLAAGIRSKTEQCSDSPDLLDPGRPLCRRARYARLRAGNNNYWSGQLQSVKTTNDVGLVLLTMFTWCTSRVILANYQRIEELLDKLDSKWWRWLEVTVRRSRAMAQVAGANDLKVTQLPKSMSTKIACLLAGRSDTEIRQAIYQTYLKGRWEEEPCAVRLAYLDALDGDRIRSAKWSPNLEVLKICYEKGHLFADTARTGDPRRIPISLAKEIAGQPLDYPAFLVALAQDRCRIQIASKAVPLADVATQDGWISQ